MSGPISLEPGDAGQDTLALRLAEPRPPRRRPRWALDDATLAIRLPGHGPDEEAVSTLAAELADAIGPAVHPYEVAALLEAEGLSASLIKERYGHPDLFSLATALYERVPRTFPEPPPATDPWRPDTVRCLLRGVLFALPALAYLLIAPLWPVDRHAPVLIVAGIASWAWGQALGHRAHLRLVTGRREASGTLLAGSALGAALATALGALPADGASAIAVAAAQSLYLAAASVLLVLGRERLLLAALSPLIAGAGVLPWWEPGPAPRVALPLLALLATSMAAGRVLWAGRAGPAASDAGRPRLHASVPYGLFGLAAAVLVMLEGRRQPYAVIALTLSMGPAEWLLYRYRGWSVAALRVSATPGTFLLRSAAVLGLCLSGYLLLLLPAALLTDSEATLLLLAAALWTALLLQAFGVAWPPAVLCLAAAGVAGAVTLLHLPPEPVVLPSACGVAAACLAACAIRLLGRPSPHA
ncbi:hypothetical protein ACM01_20345 [Streptomyces viridochromogenes]|uniref:Uncharacterized protein n=1 Tax=Streptomyces viridochromogenes TaxID=1938 RepID=A0A0J7ZBC9_STRVR|nr:hypothetical protein [Streptomyces viridochromogenes]KMS73109.1 hypothetical protein ACM01_20345 [Streptomyces viridochromogenes]KOG11872.1 hypothetical protein ADK36_36130 [Streptomyces viridochromogenes]KOG24061.1 hypothetical protein ADK35_11810 [Streptomyces viridochromogenes]